MNDGGSAFPIGTYIGGDAQHVKDQTVEPGSKGMSLRDWIAGQALHGLIYYGLAASHEPMKKSKPKLYQAVFEVIAEMAYRYADTMLAEREK